MLRFPAFSFLIPESVLWSRTYSKRLDYMLRKDMNKVKIPLTADYASGFRKGTKSDKRFFFFFVSTSVPGTQ